MGSADAFDNFILMEESAWQRRGRDRLPRTDTRMCSAATGTAQAAPALGEEKDVLGKKTQKNKNKIPNQNKTKRNPKKLSERKHEK